MKKHSLFYAVLAILVVVDAWLLAHPNLIGKFGILFYKYDMIKTLPRAFGTVAVSAIVSVLIGYVIENKLSKPTSTIVSGSMVAITLGVLIQTYFKFSSGTYAMTGAGFKTGAVLMPAILFIIFGKTLIEVLGKKE